MYLENIAKSNKRDKKRTDVQFHLYEVPRTDKFIENKYRLPEVEWEIPFYEDRVSMWDHDKFLKMDSNDGCTTL